MYELLGAAVDAVHAAAMVVWALGFPLLFWHRWRRLTRVYLVYSLSFVLLSVGSHFWLGECFLTTLAREFYDAGDQPALRERVSFIVRATEFIAGVRPGERWAVLVWEAALFVGSAGTLWHLHGERVRARNQRVPERVQDP